MAHNKTNTFEAEVLKLIFNNTNIAGIGDATGLRGSTTASSLYIRLFTSSPTEEATFTAKEATYTSYAAVAVTRNGTNWPVTESNEADGGVSGNAEATTDSPARGAYVENANAITFPQCTSGSETITHVAICKTQTGTTDGDMLYAGALNTPLTVSVGVTPQFAAQALKVYEF